MADPRAFAAVGLFDSPGALLDAIPGVRSKELGRLEAYTPYPIHGLDAALGLRRSPLAGMVLVMGIFGALSTLAFEGWASAVDYPLIVGGKRLFSWQAFVPIMFEVMVLFATFTAGLGMLLLLNRLPSFLHPLLASRAMASITRDRFALSIERGKTGPDIDVEAARAALLEAGALSVEVVPLPEPVGPLSPVFLFRGIVATGVACLAVGLALYWGIKLFPVLPPMVHMLDQPGLRAQSASAFFADGAGMRLPVPGTVARGHMPYTATPEEAATFGNPLPRSLPVIETGKRAYRTHCAVCHGILGNGTPTLTASYGAKPANLMTKPIADYPDGTIFHAITAGKNSMPSYAAELTEDERWATIHYLRVLSRAQNATDEDLK